MEKLSRVRLLAYRNKALSLEQGPELSDFSPQELTALDRQYIWFKADPRWSAVYHQIVTLLSSR